MEERLNTIFWFRSIIDIYIEILKISINRIPNVIITRPSVICDYENPEGVDNFDGGISIIPDDYNFYRFKTPLGYFKFYGPISDDNTCYSDIKTIIYEKYKYINNKFTVDSNNVSFNTLPFVKKIENLDDREKKWNEIKLNISKYLNTRYNYLNKNYKLLI